MFVVIYVECVGRQQVYGRGVKQMFQACDMQRGVDTVPNAIAYVLPTIAFMQVFPFSAWVTSACAWASVRVLP